MRLHRAVPINLTFEGNYYDLTDFLFRLRNLVIVRDGELEVGGRLFTLGRSRLQEGSLGFPQITASLTVSAYVVLRPPAAPVAPPATTAAGDDTTPRRAATDPPGGEVTA